jgi:hypothetical protein
VETLAAERQRIAEAEAALLRRRELVARLEMRSKQVRRPAAGWLEPPGPWRAGALKRQSASQTERRGDAISAR